MCESFKGLNVSISKTRLSMARSQSSLLKVCVCVQGSTQNLLLNLHLIFLGKLHLNVELSNSSRLAGQ